MLSTGSKELIFSEHALVKFLQIIRFLKSMVMTHFGLYNIEQRSHPDFSLFIFNESCSFWLCLGQS